MGLGVGGGWNRRLVIEVIRFDFKVEMAIIVITL